jgi:translation initiation factor 2 alpha subunit (eIF-2alpha)
MEQALYPVIDKEIKMLSLKDYYARLKAHDWHWSMADDSKAYKVGQKEEKALLEISYELGEEYGDLFDGFTKHYDAIVKGETAGPGVPPIPEEPK